MKRPTKYFIPSTTSRPLWLGRVASGEQVRRNSLAALKKIQVGDRWVAFAYINDDHKRDKVQQVVGFVKIPDRRIQIPPRPQ